MAVRIVPARQDAPPPERPLWRLVRGERTAHALIREWPHGHELVITIDGQLRWSQLYRGGIGLGMAAAEKRQALLDKGWLEAPTS